MDSTKKPLEKPAFLRKDRKPGASFTLCRSHMRMSDRIPNFVGFRTAGEKLMVDGTLGIHYTIITEWIQKIRQ